MTNAEIGDTEISKMAYIGRIESVRDIPDADRIESIEVMCGEGGKWMAIAQVGEFQTGDLCEVYLQDAILPDDDKRFRFMEKYRFRVKMIRLRGVPSEALVVPLEDDVAGMLVGADITSVRGVKKYTKELPANLRGIARGSFPSFIPKTDEPNFQKVPRLVAKIQEDWFYTTQKCDGTSCTFYMDADGNFGVCSRNIEYVYSKDSVYWRLARKYNLQELMKNMPEIAIQAEGVGPGIQKNRMGLDDIEIRVFDVYDIEGRRYWDGAEVYAMCNEIGLPMVKILHTLEGGTILTSDDWRELAIGTYDNGQQQEGIVVRPVIEDSVMGQRVSFKVINLEYGE